MRIMSIILLIVCNFSRVFAQSMNIIENSTTQKTIAMENIHKITFTTNQTHALVIDEKSGLQTTSILTAIDKIIFTEQTRIGDKEISAGLHNNSFTLCQNFPNPFNSSTTIEFEVEHTGHVHIEIFNMRGQIIAVPVSGMFPSGIHRTIWNGRTDSGQSVANGIYFCRISCNDEMKLMKMAFVQ